MASLLVIPPLPATTPAPPRADGRVPCASSSCTVGAVAVRHERGRARRYRRRTVAPYRSTLEAIAGCESGRRWHVATGNGFYGGLQFAASSWWAVGGAGYANTASR